MKRLRSASLSLLALTSGASALDYQNDILPILKDHCWKCHSNENEVKGGLALDDIEEMGKSQIGKVSLIRPGDPEKSDFVVRLKLDEEEDDFMPKNGKALRGGDLAKIEQWIKEGALIDAKNPTPEELARTEAAKTTTPVAGTEDFLSWTNLQGKVIEAKFAGLQGDAVKIVMRDGRGFTVPLTALQPESAAQAKKLGGQ